MNEKQQKGTFRYWMFTWNNPDDNWKTHLEAFKADYVIAQLEMGKEGTRHIQGCLYVIGAVRSTHWKGLPAWMQGLPVKDFKRVSNYSSKSDTRLEGPIEIGTRPIAAGGKDFKAALQLCKENRVLKVEPDILIPYYATLKKIAVDTNRDLGLRNMRCVWIYGPVGTGKSTYVHTKYPLRYTKMQNKWWDGYDDEYDIVEIQDADRGLDPLGHLLKIWCDPFPFIGEFKGGVCRPKHHTVLITSNFLPHQIFSDHQILAAVLRRFSYVSLPKLGVLLDPIDPYPRDIDQDTGELETWEAYIKRKFYMHSNLFPNNL